MTSSLCFNLPLCMIRPARGWFRAAVAFVLLSLLFLLPYRASAELPRPDALAKSTTRLGAGYSVALEVTVSDAREEELCGEFPLGSAVELVLLVGGEAQPAIALKDCTVLEARKKVVEAISKFYAAEPDVKICITRIPRIRVMMQGATFRNGPLTLPEGSRLSDAMAEAGYQSNADLHKVNILRTEASGDKVNLTPDFGKALQGAADGTANDPVLRNNDQIRIPLVATPVVPQTIVVLGEVKHSGTQPFTPGMKVSDALKNAMGLLASADPSRVTVRRTRDNSVMLVDANRAKQGIPTDDVALHADDTVFVATFDSGKRYAVVGAVPSPHTFDYSKPITLKAAVLDCGGFKPDADRQRVVLLRNMLSDPAHASSVVINVDNIVSGKTPDVPLQPGDLVQVPTKKRSQLPILEIGAFLVKMLVF